MPIHSITNDIFKFLKRPDFNQFSNLNFKEKIKIFFKVLILTFCAVFIANIPLTILQELDIVGEITMKTDSSYKSISKDFSDFKPYYLLMAILIIPVIEELTFRLPLIRFNVRFLLISISLLIGYLLSDLLIKYLWLPESYFWYVFMYYIYVLILFIAAYASLNLIRSRLEKLENGWNEKPGLIIYGIAVLFSVLHILNLNINNNLIFIPLFLIPTFINGLSLGYLRIRIGLAYSIAFHVLINGLSLGLQEIIKH